MANFTEDVSVRVLIDRPGFRDAIYLSVSEFEGLKDSEVEAMKEERYVTYVARIEDLRKNPPPIPEPRKEDVTAELQSIKFRVREIKTKMSDEDIKALLAEIATEAKPDNAAGVEVKPSETSRGK